MRRTWGWRNKTIPVNGSVSNVFDQISQIEDGQSMLTEEINAAKDEATVRWILIACIFTTIIVSIIQVVLNNLTNSVYRNELYLKTVDKGFQNPLIVQTVLFSAGTSTIILALLITRSDRAFAKFLPPFMKWNFYALVPPNWFYIIIYNNNALSQSSLSHNVWVAMQGIAAFVPLFLIAGIVHIMDVDRVVWSREGFAIYCASFTGVFCLITIANTALKPAHNAFFKCNIALIIFGLGLTARGTYNWYNTPKRIDSVKMRTRNKIISIFLPALSIFTFVNALSLPIAIMLFTSAYGIYILTIACISSAIFASSIMLFFTRSVIEQQSDTLEQVVVHHAEVFEKPVVRLAWTEEEDGQMGNDLVESFICDNENQMQELILYTAQTNAEHSDLDPSPDDYIECHRDVEASESTEYGYVSPVTPKTIAGPITSREIRSGFSYARSYPQLTHRIQGETDDFQEAKNNEIAFDEQSQERGIILRAHRMSLPDGGVSLPIFRIKPIRIGYEIPCDVRAGKRAHEAISDITD